MNARTGSVIGLFFAAVWLALGVSALPMPEKAISAILGFMVLAFAATRAWRRQPLAGAGFHRRPFYYALAFELGAMWIVGACLGNHGLTGYMWPAIGIIVGLHFIGLWKAVQDRRFLWLAGGMTAINLVALMLAPGSANMLALSGLGSAAALAGAIGA